MKNNIILTSLFCIALITGLSGCLSSGIPAPKSDSDTLIVVPVVIIDGKSPSYQGEVNFIVYMDNIDTGKTEKFSLSTNSHGYYYLKGIQAGKYSIEEFKTNGMNNNKTYDINISQYLVVNEGELTVFPGKLTAYIYEKESNRDATYLSYKIKEIDADQISRIEDFLENDESYGLWQ